MSGKAASSSAPTTGGALRQVALTDEHRSTEMERPKGMDVPTDHRTEDLHLLSDMGAGPSTAGGPIHLVPSMRAGRKGAPQQVSDRPTQDNEENS